MLNWKGIPFYYYKGKCFSSCWIFVGRDRNTALATARLIASSHSNIIAVSMTDPIAITQPDLQASIYPSSVRPLACPRSRPLDWQATTEMAQCVISSVSSLHVPGDNCERGGVPNPPAHGWAASLPHKDRAGLQI